MNTEVQLHPLTTSILELIDQDRNCYETISYDPYTAVRVTLRPDEILISDVFDSENYFYFYVHPVEELEQHIMCGQNWIPRHSIPDGASIIVADYKTRYKGVQHPYLYARKFFQAGLGYIERNSPTSIGGFLARWYNTDESARTNYDQFWNTTRRLRGIIPFASSDIRKQAAFDTWTGRQLKEAGYTQVEVTLNRKNAMRAVFALFTK